MLRYGHGSGGMHLSRIKATGVNADFKKYKNVSSCYKNNRNNELNRLKERLLNTGNIILRSILKQKIIELEKGLNSSRNKLDIDDNKIIKMYPSNVVCGRKHRNEKHKKKHKKKAKANLPLDKFTTLEAFKKAKLAELRKARLAKERKAKKEKTKLGPYKKD